MSADQPEASSSSSGSSAAAEAGGATPTFEKWRNAFAEFTGMGLTEEQQAAREERYESDPKKLERDWERCERYKSELMTRSPVIVFMLKHLSLSGCAFPPSALQCHPCPPSNSGGFAPDFGVLLCQNRFFNKKHMEDTIAHELIHAYDHCKFDVDWYNLRHQACSEIRAANLSGDCGWTREIRRRFFSFNKQHQACVRRRAYLSVLANPSCTSPEMAEKAVNEVWDSCFKDTRPFDEIY